MKETKLIFPARVSLVAALLLLVPLYASAQDLRNGWYKIKAEEMSVRDSKNGLVMGTLLRDPSNRFYIRYVDPKTRNAWGVAVGAAFKGCGWVVTRYRAPNGKKGTTLERDATQTGSVPSCRANENNYRRVDRRYFAARFSRGAAYTNDTPTSGDGSGAKIMPGSDFVYGNYIVGDANPARDKLNNTQKLKLKPTIYWRYFTLDRKFVMVRYGGSGLRGSGLWGFVRCSMVKPNPSDKKDKAKFDSLCVRTP
jgi:hypothetical protein